MNDLDFDELDKAINSVLTPSKSSERAKSEAKRTIKPEPRAAAPKPVERPEPVERTDAGRPEADSAEDTVKVVQRPVLPQQPAATSISVANASTASASAGIPAATRPLITPRHSINRSRPGGPLIDVMAPAKPVSRQAVTLALPERPHAAHAPKVEERHSQQRSTDGMVAVSPAPVEADPVSPATQTPAPETFERFDTLSSADYGLSAEERPVQAESADVTPIAEAPVTPLAAQPSPETAAPEAGPVRPEAEVAAPAPEVPAVEPAAELSQPAAEPAFIETPPQPASSDETAPDAETAPAAPASPFLEDAKVEKRPLGSLRAEDAQPHESADLDHRLPEHGTNDPVPPSARRTFEPSASFQSSLGAASVQSSAASAAPAPAPAVPAAPVPMPDVPSEDPQPGSKMLPVAIAVFVLAIILAGLILVFGDNLKTFFQ
ncbi:hypothetical protein JNJ66_01670 [Candidatus Saccharibacteria bacterium]|nr:hypothetical protein [Candidatus Saccharibacteria bacterium]